MTDDFFDLLNGTIDLSGVTKKTPPVPVKSKERLVDRNRIMDEIINALHERWIEIEKECRARGHKHRKQHWLNYCHVQAVTVCGQCFALGQDEHAKLYLKMCKERGIRP